MMQAVSCSGLTVYFDRNSGIRSSGTTVHFRKNKQFSGYLYSYNRDECQKYQIFIEFILIKAKRLLVPAIFASVIWIFPIQNYFYHYSFQEFFEKFILFKEGGQVWFLVMLFFIFIIINTYYIYYNL